MFWCGILNFTTVVLECGGHEWDSKVDAVEKAGNYTDVFISVENLNLIVLRVLGCAFQV